MGKDLLTQSLIIPPMSRSFAFGLAFLTVLTFASFGWYHLGKFETTDEHLWKYKRIGDYWEGWREKNFAKTYINDKPGITVAIFSGFGLIPDAHPERTELVPLSREETEFFEDYREDLTEPVNVRFRLPILIVSSLALLLFFGLTYQILASWTLALLVLLLIGFNPILVGIAQVINPDSFFWIFGFLSSLCFLSYLFRATPYSLEMTGILTGLALLSKYTAFLLFPLFGLFLLGYLLFTSDEPRALLTRQMVMKYLFAFIKIFGLATLTFFILLPASFLNPSLFFKGASQFLNPNHWPYWLAGLGLVTLLVFTLWKYGTDQRLLALQSWIKERSLFLTRSVVTVLGFILFLSLINVWTGQALAPVEALRDAAYANEPQAFNFKPVLFKTAPFYEKWFEVGLMEIFPFVFSLTPILFVGMLLGLIGLWKNIFSPRAKVIVFAIFAFILLYFFATYQARVVTNARYMIALFPLVALAGAVALDEWLRRLVKAELQQKAWLFLTVLLFLWGTFTLWQLKPFYFSYANFLLPKDQSIHDSWGHGFYEAAQYLNSLPNATELKVWSNSNTLCRFFVGKCFQSRRIDLAQTTPDYFVMSKRGVVKVRNQPVLKNNPWPLRNTAYYIDKLQNNPEWSLLINGRPDNFVNIVRFEKE